MNVHIALEEVLSKSRNLPPNRSHIASLLVKKGYAKSRSDAFKRYLKTGRDSYIPSVEPTPEEGARFIKSAGGIPVVAHPGWLKDDEAIARLVADGIMGLEVFHIYRDMSVCNKYLQIARKYRLFVTGGSDWHGVVEYPHNANLGQITCPPEYFNELEKHFGGRWVE
jgi:predicted metal-dependent phosphoesterase TrpH